MTAASLETGVGIKITRRILWVRVSSSRCLRSAQFGFLQLGSVLRSATYEHRTVGFDYLFVFMDIRYSNSLMKRRRRKRVAYKTELIPADIGLCLRQTDGPVVLANLIIGLARVTFGAVKHL